MAEVTDIRKVLRKEKRKKRLARFLIVLACLSLVAFLILNWNTISSWLVVPGSSDSLKREVETLPTEMGGTTLYQILSNENSLLVVHDAGADRYDANMKHYSRYAHSMASPRAAINGAWTVLYTPGAAKATLFHADREIQDLTGEDATSQAAVSSQGQTAIATVSDLYSSRLTVRDSSGEEFLTLDCSDQILALAFHPNCKNLAVGSSLTKSGQLIGKIRQLRLGQQSEDWSMEFPEEWVLYLGYEHNGNLIAVCSQNAYLIDNTGNMIARYSYSGSLKKAAMNENRLALAMENKEPDQTTFLLLNEKFEQIAENDVAGDVRSLSLNGKVAVITTDRTVCRYNARGKLAATYETTGNIRYAAWLNGKCIGVSDLSVLELSAVKK